MKRTIFLIMFFVMVFFFSPQIILSQSHTKLWGMAYGGGTNNLGTIFSTDTTGTDMQVQHSFYRIEGDSVYYTRLCMTPGGLLYGMTSRGGINNMGVLFAYNPADNSYVKKFDFDGTNRGKYPLGSLLRASNGKLYGMTSEGGVNNMGVLFEFDPVTDTFISRYDFDGTEGANPRGGLMQAANGNIYGMTSGGGLFGYGVIFEYDALTNTYQSKYDFDMTNGANPGGELVETPSGKLYGLTSAGGSGNLGVLFEYDPMDSIFVKKRDLVLTDGSHPQGSLVIAANGSLYGLALTGGAFNQGTLFEYNYNTNVYNCRVDFDSLNTGGKPYGSLVLASNGSLYGTTSGGGSYDRGVLFEFQTSVNMIFIKLDFQCPDNGCMSYGSMTEASNGQLYGMNFSGGNHGHGVLYKYDAVNNIFEKKLDFLDAKYGMQPSGGLAAAPNGKLYGMTPSGGNYDHGLIFEYDPTLMQYADKFDLDSINDGSNPFGSLTKISDGKLYGMTCYGGTYGMGVLFSYDPLTSTYLKLFDFDGGNSGKYPYGNLFEASNGKLYGMTSQGGQYDMGVLFEYDRLTSAYNKLFDFSGAANGKYPYGDLAEESNGKLYGMTSEGGAYNMGVLFNYNIGSGTFTVISVFDGPVLGSNPYGSLTKASNGKLYGLTANGGATGSGVLFEYDPQLLPVKKVDFNGVPKGSNPYGSLMESGNGKLYGVTNHGGTNNEGVFFEYDLATMVYSKKADLNTASGSGPKYVKLVEICDPPTYSDPSSVYLCAGSDGFFTISAAGNGLAYQWQVDDLSGGGFADIANDSMYSGVTDDTLFIYGVSSSMAGYKYKCIITSVCPDLVYESGEAILVLDPVPVITGLDSFYCFNASPEIISGFPAGGIFSGAGMADSVFNASAAGTGSHMIIYTYTSGINCTFYDTAYTSVGAVTAVSFSGLDSVYCVNSSPVMLSGSPPGGTFSGPGITGNIFNPTVGSGIYQIIYHYDDGNNCIFTDTNSVIVTPCTGLTAYDPLRYSVYPNPCKGQFYIDLPPEMRCRLKLYNAMGQLVYSANTEGNKAEKISVHITSPGIYCLEMESELQAKTLKVVVQ